jgi:hypothetical protein
MESGVSAAWLKSGSAISLTLAYSLLLGHRPLILTTFLKD